MHSVARANWPAHLLSSRNHGTPGVRRVSRSPVSGVVMSLVVAAVLLADLSTGAWLAPGATAQSAAPYHWARKRSHFRLRVGTISLATGIAICAGPSPS